MSGAGPAGAIVFQVPEIRSPGSDRRAAAVSWRRRRRDTRRSGGSMPKRTRKNSTALALRASAAPTSSDADEQLVDHVLSQVRGIARRSLLDATVGIGDL